MSKTCIFVTFCKKTCFCSVPNTCRLCLNTCTVFWGFFFEKVVFLPFLAVFFHFLKNTFCAGIRVKLKKNLRPSKKKAKKHVKDFKSAFLKNGLALIHDKTETDFELFFSYFSVNGKKSQAKTSQKGGFVVIFLHKKRPKNKSWGAWEWKGDFALPPIYVRKPYSNIMPISHIYLRSPLRSIRSHVTRTFLNGGCGDGI